MGLVLEEREPTLHSDCETEFRCSSHHSIVQLILGLPKNNVVHRQQSTSFGLVGQAAVFVARINDLVGCLADIVLGINVIRHGAPLLLVAMVVGHEHLVNVLGGFVNLEDSLDICVVFNGALHHLTSTSCAGWYETPRIQRRVLQARSDIPRAASYTLILEKPGLLGAVIPVLPALVFPLESPPGHVDGASRRQLAPGPPPHVLDTPSRQRSVRPVARAVGRHPVLEPLLTAHVAADRRLHRASGCPGLFLVFDRGLELVVDLPNVARRLSWITVDVRIISPALLHGELGELAIRGIQPVRVLHDEVLKIFAVAALVLHQDSSSERHLLSVPQGDKRLLSIPAVEVLQNCSKLIDC
mmetsp:Transcript_52940/g.140742  ORF Transcript_52940/g.140742 Transcript_52940/m.140742 type:complete len:356 (+) Transcript_52940:4134-5201(+)